MRAASAGRRASPQIMPQDLNAIARGRGRAEPPDRSAPRGPNSFLVKLAGCAPVAPRPGCHSLHLRSFSRQTWLDRESGEQEPCRLTRLRSAQSRSVTLERCRANHNWRARPYLLAEWFQSACSCAWRSGQRSAIRDRECLRADQEEGEEEWEK